MYHQEMNANTLSYCFHIYLLHLGNNSEFLCIGSHTFPVPSRAEIYLLDCTYFSLHVVLKHQCVTELFK